MSEVKQPEDHKPKKKDPKVVTTDLGWTVTHRGIKLTILKESLDDFELLDDLAALQADEQKAATRFPGMLRRLAGDAGFKAVTDGMRAENGRVPIAATVKFILEVFEALNPNG